MPAFEVDGKIFWGFVALPMLRAYLADATWFSGGDWESASKVSVGVNRKN